MCRLRECAQHTPQPPPSLFTVCALSAQAINAAPCSRQDREGRGRCLLWQLEKEFDHEGKFSHGARGGADPPVVALIS